jgi:hypothetical protein
MLNLGLLGGAGQHDRVATSVPSISRMATVMPDGVPAIRSRTPV